MNDLRRINRLSIALLVFFMSFYAMSISMSLTSRNMGEGFMRINEIEVFLVTGQTGWSPEVKWGSLGRDGLRYNWHQMGQNIFALPLYLFMRESALSFYIVNIAATSVTVVLLMRMLVLLGFRPRPATLTALCYGLGSLAWFYASKTPHEHALAIALSMGGMYYAMRYQLGYGRDNLYLCLICIGFGLTVRYDAVLTLLPIAIYLFMGRDEEAGNKFSIFRSIIIGAMLLLPFFAMNFTYNYVRFGDIFESGYAGSRGAPEKLFGLEFLPRGLIGALISPGKSIFLFSPVLLFFFFYVREFKARVERKFFVAYCAFLAIYVVFYSLHHSWDGDWCFGPRYFLVIVPFMLMPLAAMFERFRDKALWKKMLIVGLILISVFVQVAFVTSNTAIPNMMKYGVDDDSRPELSKQFARNFGVHGSWQWLAGFFPLRYSQFLNQLKVFWYTLLIQIDSSNVTKVHNAIERSDTPYVNVYFGILMEFDLWWRQRAARVNPNLVFLFVAVSGASLVYAIRASRNP